jgi:hypothetical protein
VDIFTTTHPKKDALNLTHHGLIGVAVRSLEGFLKVFLKQTRLVKIGWICQPEGSCPDSFYGKFVG